MCDWVLEPVISKWQVDSVGFVLKEVGSSSSGKLINHCVWADNLFLLARSAAESRRMITEVTCRLYSTMGCRWKMDSLQIMPNSWAKLDHSDLRRERFSVAVEVPVPVPRSLCWRGGESLSAPSSASMKAEPWWNRAERSTGERKRAADHVLGAEVSRRKLERVEGGETPSPVPESHSSKRHRINVSETGHIDFHFEIVSELLVLGVLLDSSGSTRHSWEATQVKALAAHSRIVRELSGSPLALEVLLR